MEDAGDLREGAAPREASSLLKYYRLDEQRQDKLLLAALLFCAVMTGGFLWFVYRLVGYYLQAVPEGQEVPVFDWHILLIGSSLIVPPTIVMLALLAKIYPKPGGQAAGGEDVVTPLSQALKTVSDLASTLTETIKSIKT